jgi:hypothetical protein
MRNAIADGDSDKHTDRNAIWNAYEYGDSNGDGDSDRFTGVHTGLYIYSGHGRDDHAGDDGHGQSHGRWFDSDRTAVLVLAVRPELCKCSYRVERTSYVRNGQQCI